MRDFPDLERLTESQVPQAVTVGAIHDLVDERGNYLKYAEFNDKYPELKTNFLTYTGLISAIKKISTKIKYSPSLEG